MLPAPGQNHSRLQASCGRASPGTFAARAPWPRTFSIQNLRHANNHGNHALLRVRQIESATTKSHGEGERTNPNAATRRLTGSKLDSGRTNEAAIMVVLTVSSSRSRTFMPSMPPRRPFGITMRSMYLRIARMTSGPVPEALPAPVAEDAAAADA